MLMCGRSHAHEEQRIVRLFFFRPDSRPDQNKHWINQPPETISNVWEHVFFGKYEISQCDLSFWRQQRRWRRRWRLYVIVQHSELWCFRTSCTLPCWLYYSVRRNKHKKEEILNLPFWLPGPVAVDGIDDESTGAAQTMQSAMQRQLSFIQGFVVQTPFGPMVIHEHCLFACAARAVWQTKMKCVDRSIIMEMKK